MTDLLAEQLAYYRALAADYHVDPDAARELAAALQARLRGLGWRITVTAASGPYWGEGVAR